jgi:hypothetical protein
LASVFFIPFSLFTGSIVQAVVSMDVKCTVYNHSDDVNGDNVDVRTLVKGLKGNSEYTAQVVPDHNPATTVTSKTDSEGIFWAVAKILNGEKSTLFKVNVYEGKGNDKRPVVSGDDDAPCYVILFPSQISK